MRKTTEGEIFRQLKHLSEDNAYTRRLIENHLNDCANPHRVTAHQTHVSGLPTRRVRALIWLRLLAVFWGLLMLSALSVVGFIAYGYWSGNGEMGNFGQTLWLYSTEPEHLVVFGSLLLRAFLVIAGAFVALLTFSNRAMRWVLPAGLFHGQE